eukprot:gene5620-9437_t
MVNIREEKDVYKLLEKLKSTTVLLEGLISKKHKNKYRDYNFSLTAEYSLYFMDLKNNKYEVIQLMEVEKRFQKTFSDNKPFQITVEDLEISFWRHQNYLKFIEILRKLSFEELKPEFNKIKLTIEYQETRKWSTSQVLEWLSSIYHKGCWLSKYEDIFESKEIDGQYLLGLSDKNFQSLGVSLDNTSALSKEKNKLLQAEFDPSKVIFQHKIQYLCHNDEHLMSKLHNNLIFSLCDPDMIKNTFLRIAKEDSEMFKDQEIQVRFIFTEPVHNSDKMETLDIFNPVIKNLQKFDYDDKYIRFHGALLIGPWYLEFGNTSICVPKRLTKSMMEFYNKIRIFTLHRTTLKDIQECISPVVAEFNAKYAYKDWTPDTKTKQGNCYTFMEEILYSLDILPDYNGSLHSFLDEMKTFGNSGAAFFPTDSKKSYEDKFGFSFIPDISTHVEVDEILDRVLSKLEDFPNHFPHDYIVLQAIDLGFWLRGLEIDDDAYDPLFDGEKTLCCCFDEKFINEIPRIKEEKIDSNLVRLSEQRQSKVVKKLSNVGLKRGFLHDTTLKHSIFGKKFTEIELKGSRSSTNNIKKVSTLTTFLKK